MEKFSVRGDGKTIATSSEISTLSVPVLTARATGTGTGTAGYTGSAVLVEVATTGVSGTGSNFYLMQVMARSTMYLQTCTLFTKEHIQPRRLPMRRTLR